MDLRLPTAVRIPPMWREGLVALEAARLLGSAEWRGVGQAPGTAAASCSIPGFLAGDASLGVMTRWLRSLGYRTRKAGIRSHVGCSTEVVRLPRGRAWSRWPTQTGDRVADHRPEPRRHHRPRAGQAPARPRVGHRHARLPERGHAQHPPARARLGRSASARSGRLKVPHLFSFTCLFGECCADFRDSLHAPRLPRRGRLQGRLLAPRRDRQLALLPGPRRRRAARGRLLALGMGFHPHVYGVVGRALAEFADVADEPVWTPWTQAA